MCLLVTAIPEGPVVAAGEWNGSESSDPTPCESEESGDPLETSATRVEFVASRPRGERVIPRTAPALFLMPPIVEIGESISAPSRFEKALPGGRHARRNGLGAPLRC